MTALNKIITKLETIQSYNAFIPAAWNSISANKNKEINVKFPDYFIDKLNEINIAKVDYSNRSNPTIYNVFVRLSTAFNHSKTGKIANENGKFRETGTILKTIAMLPYIKSLGTDILYLLPITSIGKDGKKGDLGSPYSINNPYSIDENIGEPLLEMPIEEQFEALIEAAHKIGIKVVCEFIFRTASKDSKVAITNPEWFYWIKKECQTKFRSPIFDEKTLKQIKEKVEVGDYNNLPEPNFDYINQFTDTPEKVELIDGKIIGFCGENQVVIPEAFADWPPNDIQPPWSDVTYLKIYDNQKFNYIAYNTIRMYDVELAKPLNENTPLWRHIENIIPFYQNRFNIDGVMIDMGHALPDKLLKRIVAKAKRINKDFIFWEENFVLSAGSKEKGFDCVAGTLPFDEHNCEKMRHFIANVHNLPTKCFATAETHNTPRTASRKGGERLSKIVYLINKILPLPTFILSGFELSEKMPMNTGVGFENIDTSELNAEVLPLFSTSALCWTNENNIIHFITEANAILDPYLTENYTLKTICSENNSAVAFEIIGSNKLIFIANYDNSSETIIDLGADTLEYKKLFGDAELTLKNNKLSIKLKEFSFIILSELSKKT